MALRFYIGGSGSGKSRAVYEKIIEESLRERHRRFLVLVPEQATMETQRQIIRLHPRHGIMNIDVLSMTRLAYRVFAEVGYRREEMLEEIGKTFLLEKIALAEQKNLPHYGRLLPRPEFLAEMKATISELMVYGVEPENIRALFDSSGAGDKRGDVSGAVGGESNSATAGKDKSGGSAASVGLLPADSVLSRKLRDIELVYRRFRERLAGSYMTAEELPERLSHLAEKSQLIRGSVLVLDGFTGFTPLQVQLLEKLLPLVSDIYVTVTMDPRINPFAPYRETDLFSLGSRMVQELQEMAKKAGVETVKPVYIENGASSRHGSSPQLQQLEKRLFRNGGRRPAAACCSRTADIAGGTMQVIDQTAQASIVSDRTAQTAGPAAQSSPDIRIFSAGTPRGEIAFVADEICRMVRTEGFRYRDFAVVSGDLATYGRYVRERFGRDDIPYFIDEKRPLTANPFMEYLRAALEACTENYTYSGMFRMLKSGVTDFDGAAVDQLENYVIACGIRGKNAWRKPFTRIYVGEDPAEIMQLNALREEILSLLDPLAEVLAKRGGTVREKTEALRAFCIASRAEEKLTARGEHFEAEGRGELAREYAQVWPYIDSFLDKLTQVLGDEKVSMRDFRALIEAGFGEARVAVIPPGSDRVLIGDMERSRLMDIRVLFFVGVNEGMIPKTPSGGGILSEADRTQLLTHKVALKPTARTQLFIDRFYLYLTLTKPSQRLILSYASANAAGEVMRPAYLIGTLQRLFPEIQVEKEAERAGRLPEREGSGISALTRVMASLDDALPDATSLELFAHYRRQPAYARRCGTLLEAASMRKQTDSISRAAARALYGDVLSGSASRLEKYAACKYAHFLAYGLRLRPRQEYEFSGLGLGSILHDALEHFALMARRDGKTWADLKEDADSRKRYADESIREAVIRYGSGIFTDSARDAYAVSRMQRLMEETVWVQAEQLAAGDFAPAGEEAAFGGRDGLSSFNAALPGGGRLELMGRIDRIDTCDADGRTYVKIIDYKTGNVKFDFNELYHGLQLQLAIYMNAALRMFAAEGRETVPAGMFYYQVQDKVVDYVPLESAEETKRRRLKEMRASGLLLKDTDVALHFDHDLAYNGSSIYVPLEITKSGSFHQRTKAVAEEDFRRIGKHAERLAVRYASEIMAGHVEVDPYQLQSETACDFCPFKSVCGFDRRIPGYRYRLLAALKTDEILARIQEEQAEDL